MPKGSAIYAKLEYLNPGGSIKDRLGSYLIKEGFAQGKSMKNDDHRTNCRKYRNWDRSGRTHIQIKNGFVVPEKFSLEKQQLMKALGAKIIHSPSEQGIIGAISKSKTCRGDIKQLSASSI